MKIRAIFLVMFISVPCLAQDPPPTPALPLNVVFVQPLAPIEVEQLKILINTALVVVASFPPSGMTDSLFDWKSDREILKGKSLAILVSDSNDPLIPVLKTGPGGFPPDQDSVTFVAMNLDEKTMYIQVVLFTDRLFFEKNVARKDAFARLIISFAHEIYGHVQRYLSMNVSGVQHMDLEMRAKGQIEAFEVSVKFLEELLKNPELARLPENVRKDLAQLLPDEKHGLKNWQRILRQCKGHLN